MVAWDRVTRADVLRAIKEYGKGQAWQYQQTRRSLFAQPVHGWLTRRDPLCQGAWHAASALAR